MGHKVLVAYASKKGGAAEIAETIGRVLRETGVATDVLPVKRVGDLTPYTAVVLGSALYIGRWRKDAVAFLKRQGQAMAERPVWLFSSGPTGEGDPVELVKGMRLPPGLAPVLDRIHARDVAVFHGVLDPAKMNWFERWIIKQVKAPVGDFRDWSAIRAWATSIAEALST